MSEGSTSNYGLVYPIAGTAEPVDQTDHLKSNWEKIDQDMNRFDVQIFTSTGTWNKPERCKRVMVEVVGGGGGSGGVGSTTASQAAQSAGGGGGGYSRKLFLTSALSASETVTIGAAGVAGTNAPAAGGNGGDSSFATGKAYVVTANGGTGGQPGPATATVNTAYPGVGGSASGGDINIPGGVAGAGLVLIGPAAGAIGAYPNNYGGASRLSGQSSAPASSSVGNIGTNYGGGASGSVNGISQSARAGAAGAAGIVIIFNFY